MDKSMIFSQCPRESSLPLTEEQRYQLNLAVANAESMSSIEYKIILVKSSWLGIRHQARQLFKKYNLHQTKGNTAVLVLVDYKHKSLCLYGDSGVSSRLGKTYWDELNDLLVDAIKANDIYEAILSCVAILGHQLPIYFPISDDDQDEISNELIFEG